MNDLTSTTTAVPTYDPDAVIVTLSGLDPKPTLVKAWFLSGMEQGYWTMMTERNDACAKISSAVKVLLDNRANLDSEFVSEMAEALGVTLTGSVRVVVEHKGEEVIEFTTEVSLDTDLSDFAQTIESKLYVTSATADVSLCGRFTEGGKWVDEVGEVEVDHWSLDLEFEVTCEWE